LKHTALDRLQVRLNVILFKHSVETLLSRRKLKQTVRI